MNRPAVAALAAFALALSLPLDAVAAQPDIDQVRAATAKLIGLLVEQGVLARDKGEVLLDEVTKPVARPSAAATADTTPVARSGGGAKDNASGTVRVPYIPQFVRNELKEELRAELAAQALREGWAGPGVVPAWVRGLKWDGDLRTRLQFDRYADDNVPAVNVTETNRSRATTLLNTSEDRQRMRVRARLGLSATLDEHWAVGVRLTTGSTSDPISSNQTLGVYNNRYTAAFDRAYLRYRHGEEFNVVAGRFGNPWFGTDLVWANDLSFDGVAVQWTPRIAASARGFVTLAALPVQEVELSSADKWLFGAQAGVEMPRLIGEGGGKLGLGYYRYTNLVGRSSPAGRTDNEFTAPAFAQKGNTYYNIAGDPARPLLGLAAEYRIVNLTGTLDLPLIAGKHALLTADVAKNLGFDRAAVAARVGADVEPQTVGWLARVAFGDRDIAKWGDWQVFAAYRHVERDAVLDAFTDSDFRLGGTDAKGYILGGSIGLGKQAAGSLRLLSADSISGAPLSVDVLQADLLLRF
ncbi:MAG TPA: putative porin [Methylibium sp.]|nr:putative porin [Methylibium sp.]